MKVLLIEKTERLQHIFRHNDEVRVQLSCATTLHVSHMRLLKVMDATLVWDISELAFEDACTTLRFMRRDKNADYPIVIVVEKLNVLQRDRLQRFGVTQVLTHDEADVHTLLHAVAQARVEYILQAHLSEQ